MRKRLGIPRRRGAGGAAGAIPEDAEVTAGAAEDGESSDEFELVEETVDDPERNRWDCETIVSTYSNLDNHPALLDGKPRRERKPPAPAEKIVLSTKTGARVCGCLSPSRFHVTRPSLSCAMERKMHRSLTECCSHVSLPGPIRSSRRDACGLCAGAAAQGEGRAGGQRAAAGAPGACAEEGGDRGGEARAQGA